MGAGKVIVPEYVRKFAAQNGISDEVLRSLTPTADDGILSLLEVSQFAEDAGDTDLALAALSAQSAEIARFFNQRTDRAPAAGRRSHAPSSGYRSVTTDEIGRTPLNAMARNPLVEQVRAAARRTGRAAPGGTPPTLFASGTDVPLFTASGIPPETVLRVPWQARVALASAPTAADAHAIMAQFNGVDDDVTAELFYGDDEGNLEYRERVDRWRLASMSDEELLSGMVPSGAGAELDRRDAERYGTGLPDDDDAAIEDFVTKNYGGGR